MPNRYVREPIASSVQYTVSTQSCKICGRAGDIEADHIIPVRDGGSSDRYNIQPLCRLCNVKRREFGSNAAVAVWISNNLSEYRERQEQRLGGMFFNRYWGMPFNFLDEAETFSRGGLE